MLFRSHPFFPLMAEYFALKLGSVTFCNEFVLVVSSCFVAVNVHVDFDPDVSVTVFVKVAIKLLLS